MGIIISRPEQLPKVSIVAPSSANVSSPYHKRHYYDDNGVISIDVVLDKAARGGESVDFSHVGGIAGIDYIVITPSPLVFGVGDTTAQIQITPTNKVQFFEYFEVTTSFTGSAGLKIDGWADQVLTVIHPRTVPPTVDFDLAASGASVGGGFSITASVAKLSAANVTLLYSLGGTVDLDEVTIPASGTLLIPAGSLSATIIGSFSGSVSIGETLEVTLTHEDGTIVPELALRQWPSTNEFMEARAGENVIGESDPEVIEMHTSNATAHGPIFPGVPSKWGPGGVVTSGPPGTVAADFLDQEDASPLINPFTGKAHKMYVFSAFTVGGTPYIRESFADVYCDGPAAFGDPIVVSDDTLLKGPSGVNVGNVDGFTASRIWVDVMKSARLWGTIATGDFGFGDVGVNPLQDAQGWPLPVIAEDEDYFALINWDGGLNSMPDGDYLVTWDGDGDVIFGQAVATGFSVSAVADVTSNSKTITIDMGANDTGIYCRVTASTVADPVRNIRIMRPGFTKDTHEVFTPEFITAMKRYSSLRFMDWQGTNFSPVVDFADITAVDYFSYALEGGVPIEIILRAAAEAQADAWLCMPHQATDACVTAWAKAVKAARAPLCRIYIEYTNEYWNEVFSTFGVPSNPIGQWDYALLQANIRGLTGSDNDKRAKFHGQRSAEIWVLCDAEWRAAGSSVRRTRVLSGFISNIANASLGLAETGVEDKTDLVAIAPYIGNATANLAAFETDSDAVSEGLFDADLTAMFAVSGPIDLNIADMVGRTNLEGDDIKIAFYEGGQDFTPVMNAFGGSWTDDDVVRLKAIRINKSSFMAAWYTDFLTEVQTLVDAKDVFISYLYEAVSKYGDTVSNYVGQFGLAEYTGQTDSTKLNAVLDTLEVVTTTWNPPAFGSLSAFNRLSLYIAFPQGRDAFRSEGVKYAQITLRNRSKSINHQIAFRFDFPSTVGQFAKDGTTPVAVTATAIGNVGMWIIDDESGVTPMEFGVIEDEFGVRIWMIHHADDVTLYSATYANIGDVDGDGSSDASGNWPDHVGRDSANAILRFPYTDVDIISAAGGLENIVSKGMIGYGIMHERSQIPLSGPPGPYRRRPRLWYEPEGLANIVPAGTNLHTVTIA